MYKGDSIAYRETGRAKKDIKKIIMTVSLL